MIEVLNDHGKHNPKERKRLTSIFHDSFEQVINSLDPLDRSREILNNIIVINLHQPLEEVEDDEENGKIEMKIKPAYGMDLIFKKIYDMFQKHKISIYEIEIAKDVKEMKDRIKKYDLLNNIQKIEDIFINIRKNLMIYWILFNKLNLR